MTIGGRDRFGKMGNLGVADTSRILDVCREAGVTTLDTADVYSFGGAEEILGEALEGRRHDFVLVTKALHAPRHRAARRRPVAQAPDRGVRGEPAPAAHGLHRSLHLPPAGHRSSRSTKRMRAFDDLVPQGKVRYVGLLESFGVAGHEGAGRLRSVRADPLHLPAGELLADRPRRRARDHPARPRSVSGPDGVEPAARRAADRQVPPRRAAVGQPPERARCAGHDRLRARLPDRRRADGDRAGARASRRRRWRSTGC